ncbi:MAG: carboxyvinyl-carboxyphosphonate phosphorylmutase, partial [Novosphingobium sp.]
SDVVCRAAPSAAEDLCKACSVLDKPCMANMANHGKTPIPPAKVLEEIGYAYAIYPSLTSLAAAAAAEKVLRDLKDNGIGEPDDLFDFGEFCSLIGFEDVWAFEKKWGKVPA